MKKVIAAMLIGCMAFNVMAGDEQIRVRSTETQGGEKSQTLEKSSQGQLPGKDNSHDAKQKAPSISKERPQSKMDDPDFWIYDAWVTLLTDFDYDGYYSRFEIEFDVDTVYNQADVYARLYLSRGNVFEEFHTTSIFTINGDSSNDSLIVDSELLSGFVPGDYELMIELYDAFDDALVVTYDGFNDADLTLLTLESQNYEVTEPVVVVTDEGGGSFGYLMLLLAPLLLRRIKA